MHHEDNAADPRENPRQDPLERYSRRNYGSRGDDEWKGGTQVSRWPREEGGFGYNGQNEPGTEMLSDRSYINESPNVSVSSYSQAYEYDALYDNEMLYDRPRDFVSGGRRGRDASDGISSRPTGTVKKRHPIRNFFLVILGILVAFGLFNVVSCAIKSDSSWAEEYSGTWQMKATSGAGNPVLSVGATFFASSNSELGKQMIVGIYGNEAQMQSFGTVKDYVFTFDKGHFKLTPKDGNGGLSGDLLFGYLLVSNADGSTTVYKRTAKTYDPVSPETAGFDADALVSTLKGLAASAGIDPSALDAVDTQALSEKLSGVSPETIQEALNSVDIGALASGNTENAIDLSSPAVNEIIESAAPDQAVNVSAEQVNQFLDDTGINLNSTPEELSQQVSDLWNQSPKPSLEQSQGQNNQSDGE